MASPIAESGNYVGRILKGAKPGELPVQQARIEPAAEIGSRATDGRPLEQAIADLAVMASAFEWD